jgi:hypothetical protein
MTTLVIEGRRVKVDDSFRDMAPEQREAAIEEIARSLGLSPEADDAPRVEPVEAGGEDQEGGWGDTVKQFGDRFNRGLYGMVNLPTSLANAATGMLGIDYEFQRPLEAAAPSIDEAIMDVDEPTTPGARLAGTVGEFMGANALPGMGMIAAAPRIAAATQGATSLAGQSVNRAAQGIAAAPGTAAAGEALASAGSGLGASMAEGAGPNAEYLASVAGGLLAPAALAVSPANLVRKGVGHIRSKMSPEALAAQQRRQITQGIRDNLTPEGQAAINDTMAIQQDVSGYRPSVAEATENPSFIATQREFEAGLSGPDLDRATRRYGQNEQAISRAVDELAPQSPMDVDQAFRTGKQRIQGISRNLDRMDAMLSQRQSDIGTRLQSGQRQRELGGAIREDLIARRASTKEEMGITAREFGLNDPTPRYHFEGVKQRLLQVVQPRSAMADRSALPSGIIADIREAPAKVSIDDLMTLRTRITDDIREASRLPSREKSVPYLQAMKTELDASVDQLMRQAGDNDIADNLAQFRQMYRDDYIQPFEQGAAAKVLKTDGSGAYTVADEKVAKEFFSGWSQTAADQFRRVFPNNARAHAAMEAAALDDLFSFSVRDGVIQPAQIEAWMRKNAGVLNDFPALARKVRGVDTALKDVASRRATIAARKRQVESSVLAREISRIENASTTAEAVVQQAVRNPARMERLMKGLKTDAARKAVAREVWDTVLRSNDPVAFLRQHQAATLRALGPHYKTAQNLARAIEKNRLVPRPTGRALDTNPVASVEGVLGTGLNQISSRVFAVKSGRTSSRYALADIAGRAFRSMTARQARQTLQEALYDPAVARDLANMLEAPEMTTAPALNRLYTFILSNGIAAETAERDRLRKPELESAR